jgi:hypothetical protein
VLVYLCVCLHVNHHVFYLCSTWCVALVACLVVCLSACSGAALDLSGLQLASLPEDWPRALQRARSLDCADTSISVTAIDFSDNCLQGVPKELFTPLFAGSLRELVLTSNQLGGRIHRDPGDRNPLIPPCVTQLTLSKNRLSSREAADLLTGVRGSAPPFSLLRLLMPYNLLDSIPAALSAHTGLRELQV